MEFWRNNMPDNKVIIVDETSEEDQELSPEEYE